MSDIQLDSNQLSSTPQPVSQIPSDEKKDNLSASPWEDDLPLEEPKKQIIGTLDKQDVPVVNNSSFVLPKEIEPTVKPIQPKPAQPESQLVQPESVQSQPVQSKPMQSQSAQAKPAQSQPMQQNPVQAQPVQSAPIRPTNTIPDNNNVKTEVPKSNIQSNSPVVNNAENSQDDSSDLVSKLVAPPINNVIASPAIPTTSTVGADISSASDDDLDFLFNDNTEEDQISPNSEVANDSMELNSNITHNANNTIAQNIGDDLTSKVILPAIEPNIDENKQSYPVNSSINQVEVQNTDQSVDSPESLPKQSSRLSFLNMMRKNPMANKSDNQAKIKDITKKQFSIHPIVSAVSVILVAFITTVILTENGLMSIGAEKIYGAVGLEQLWGGLSKDSEKALFVSMAQMKSNSSMKISGNIILTADKTIKSPVTTPLLSLEKNNTSNKDMALAPRIAAETVLNYYYGTSSDESDSEYDYSDTTTESTTDTTDTTDSVSTDNTSTDQIDASSTTTTDDTSTSDTQAVSSDLITEETTTEETSNIKEISAEINAYSNGSLIKGDITLDNDSNRIINLISDGKKLYVKSSSDIKFDKNSDPEKWLLYGSDSGTSESVWSNLFSASSSSGLSISGKRQGSEKIGNQRTFHYKIDKMEIGDSLKSIGIQSDTVQTVSGDIWIGIKDKLIKKVSLKITTSISSSVSIIQADLIFDSNVEKQSIAIPEQSEIVQAGGTVTDELTESKIGDEKRKEDIDSILVALKKYKDSVGSYPISKSLLKLSEIDNIIEKALVPTYMTSLPVDPKSSDGWYYAYKSNDGKTCSLSAKLEDQMDATGTMVGEVMLYLKYNLQ